MRFSLFDVEEAREMVRGTADGDLKHDILKAAIFQKKAAYVYGINRDLLKAGVWTVLGSGSCMPIPRPL
jgi:hypothetical protein